MPYYLHYLWLCWCESKLAPIFQFVNSRCDTNSNHNNNNNAWSRNNKRSQLKGGGLVELTVPVQHYTSGRTSDALTLSGCDTSGWAMRAAPGKMLLLSVAGIEMAPPYTESCPHRARLVVRTNNNFTVICPDLDGRFKGQQQQGLGRELGSSREVAGGERSAQRHVHIYTAGTNTNNKQGREYVLFLLHYTAWALYLIRILIYTYYKCGTLKM